MGSSNATRLRVAFTARRIAPSIMAPIGGDTLAPYTAVPYVICYVDCANSYGFQAEKRWVHAGRGHLIQQRQRWVVLMRAARGVVQCTCCLVLSSSMAIAGRQLRSQFIAKPSGVFDSYF